VCRVQQACSTSVEIEARADFIIETLVIHCLARIQRLYVIRFF